MGFFVKHVLVILLVALLLCMTPGCASKDVDPTLAATYEPARPGAGAVAAAPTVPTVTAEDDFEFDDSALDADGPGNDDTTIADPLKPWNSMWFNFNNFLYLNILKPVYWVYESVTPDALRSGLSNALRNLQAPIRIVNSILQLEFAQAVVEFGRFIVNTTAGGLGLAEIVRAEASLVPINLASANFSGTLARWGMGEGVYLVWPLLGPSTVRDTFGMAGDMVAGIPFWASNPVGPISRPISYGVTGSLDFNEFGGMLNNYETLIKVAIEPYTALRDAYVKLRRNSTARSTHTLR